MGWLPSASQRDLRLRDLCFTGAMLPVLAGDSGRGSSVGTGRPGGLGSTGDDSAEPMCGPVD